MSTKGPREPLLVVNYVDPLEGVRGFLVINDLKDGLASGGMRIQKGLTLDTLVELARNMTLKQQAVGIDTGGAKSGLSMEPDHPSRRDIVKRFFQAIKPLICECYNMGPDLNTTMSDLESIAKEAGIPSLKMAVGRRRGVPDTEYLNRYRLFEEKVGAMTLNQLRAPKATESCVASALAKLGISPSRARVAIQGAGNMGGGLAYLLSQRGIPVVAWSDADKCLISSGGLEVESLLAERADGILPRRSAYSHAERDAIFDVECDVLVLAAVSRCFSDDVAGRLRARSIVEAANLALEPEVEEKLHRRGVLIVPDLVASVGGSVAVQALYQTVPRTAGDILGFIERRIESVCADLFREMERTGHSARGVLSG